MPGGLVIHLHAHMLREELPEHRSIEYTYRAVEGRIAFLEWAYEDENVRVRDGADSYLIENGKIVAQTIHYTVEKKEDMSLSVELRHLATQQRCARQTGAGTP